MKTPIISRALQAVAEQETRPEIVAFGGGLEGADRTSRETVSWTPALGAPDQIINSAKPLADARSTDMVRNDGYAAGADVLMKDSIVGSQFRLNANPNWQILGAPEAWAEEFQIAAESRFNLIAESENAYLDARGINTFTNKVRLAVGTSLATGEILATAEWDETRGRPIKTNILDIAPERLLNPHGEPDTMLMRRGIERTRLGQPIAYHIRNAQESYYAGFESNEWVRVPAFTPWGRRRVIHIFENRQPDQSRGISDMVAVLKQMRMTKKFQELVLQNVVVNASYAAAIESELPTAEVFASLGAGDGSMEGMLNYFKTYMGAVGAYLESSKNIAVDGVKIPHLFPGTKMNVHPIGTPGGVGTGYEESLLRHIAAALGLSYEEFSRDYTKTNYSSARASMNNTIRAMRSKKKMTADRYANQIYILTLEEMLRARDLPLPPGWRTRDIYKPLHMDALAQCSWIGSGRGQIDELKETQAAILRIKSGLSTYEKECAMFGEDFREVFRQRAREEGLLKKHGLVFILDTNRDDAGLKQQANEQGQAGDTNTESDPDDE